MLHDRPHHLVQRWITYRRRLAFDDLFLGPYPALICGFRRSRPGIPNVFRAPFQSDAAHQSNLMAPRVVSSRRPVPVIS
jgi:hypothetical protein